MKIFLRKIKNNFFTGLIILFPLIISIFLLRFLYIKLDQWILQPGVEFLLKFFPYFPFVFLFKILIFLIFILSVSFLGLATKNILAWRLISSFERLISRLPLFGKIYSGTKEISDALLLNKRDFFRRVVLVEFPREGSYSIGFITSEVKGEIKKMGEEMVSVFVPTTPNPTSGFLLFVPMSKLIPLDISVEEGIKMVVSFGMIAK